MFSRIVMSALLAGGVAGLFVFAGHMWKTSPLILHAEIYESGGGTPQVTKTAQSGERPVIAEGARNHSHYHEDRWAPGSDLKRHAFTLLSDILTAVGFGFLLVGAMVLGGQGAGWRNGMIWGLCGYAAFYLAPAFGLAPELPGMAAVDLLTRQTWWLSTAASTSAALALLFFARGSYWKVAAFGLLLVPHIIGAPHPEVGVGVEVGVGIVPAELAAQFAVATLVITGMFWLVLGAGSGYFLERLEKTT
jgi:cobalt transporter subunit CbtA